MARAAGERIAHPGAAGRAVLGFGVTVGGPRGQPLARPRAELQLEPLRANATDVLVEPERTAWAQRVGGIGAGGELDLVLRIAAEQRGRAVEPAIGQRAVAVRKPEIEAGTALGGQLRIAEIAEQLEQRRCLEPLAHAGAQAQVIDNLVAQVSAEADRGAEPGMVVDPPAYPGGEPAVLDPQLGVGPENPRAAPGVEQGAIVAPFVLAAEMDQQRAKRPPFAAQGHPVAGALAGEGRTERGVEIVAPGFRVAVAATHEQRPAVVDRAGAGEELAGFLRFRRVGQYESRCREAVNVEIALGIARAGEHFECVGQVKPPMAAQRPLLEPVGFGASRGGGKAVGAEVAGGHAKKTSVTADAAGHRTCRGIASAVFSAGLHAAFCAGGSHHHSADRVRAPHGRIGRAQHLDLVEVQGEQIAEVEPATRCGRIGHPHPVEYDQRLLRLRPAQAHAGEVPRPAVAGQGQAGNTLKCPREVCTLHAGDLRLAQHRDRLAGRHDIHWRAGCSDGDRCFRQPIPAPGADRSCIVFGFILLKVLRPCRAGQGGN